MDEKKELELAESNERREFLKLLGATLGTVGLFNLFGSTPPAHAEQKKKYIVVITHGGNNPNRAILGLLVAETALSKGFGEVNVWFTLEGGDLANKNKAENIISPIFKKFGNALELMKKIKDKKGWFGVCPPCAEYSGAEGNDKLDFVEKAGADWLIKNAENSIVLWF
jgi:predicted peroxiredoxin